MIDKELIEIDKLFFYFISKNEYIIADVELLGKSYRTFDISLFDLANNSKLLNVLCLYYMNGNYGVTYTYESRAKWFAGYLAAFNNQDTREEQREKSNNNPMIRLLVENSDMFEKIKKILE